MQRSTSEMIIRQKAEGIRKKSRSENKNSARNWGKFYCLS